MTREADIRILAEKLMGYTDCRMVDVIYGSHYDDCCIVNEPDTIAVDGPCAQRLAGMKDRWFNVAPDPYTSPEDFMDAFKKACERWYIKIQISGDVARVQIMVKEPLADELVATTGYDGFQTAVCDAIVAALNKEAGE